MWDSKKISLDQTEIINSNVELSRAKLDFLLLLLRPT